MHPSVACRHRLETSFSVLSLEVPSGWMNLGQLFLGWLAVVMLLLPSTASARDVVSLDSVSLAAPGQTVQIPIYVRDTSGTALGIDAGTGRRIQGLALHVAVLPANAVTSLSLLRAGITSPPQTLFETSAQVANRVYGIMSFDEAASPLPFTVDAPFPGDQVATLELELSASFDEGLVVLSLLNQTTALSNQAGVLVETTANQQLRLVGGTVLVSSSGLFADGFETSDASAWAASFP